MLRLKIGVIDELLEARYHAKSQSWMTYRIRDDGKVIDRKPSCRN